jgi:hypothetical protein
VGGGGFIDGGFRHGRGREEDSRFPRAPAGACEGRRQRARIDRARTRMSLAEILRTLGAFPGETRERGHFARRQPGSQMGQVNQTGRPASHGLRPPPALYIKRTLKAGLAHAEEHLAGLTEFFHPYIWGNEQSICNRMIQSQKERFTQTDSICLVPQKCK